MSNLKQVITLDKLGKNDIDQVGGKNASLGEMISHLTDLGVSVPGVLPQRQRHLINFCMTQG